jgi:hypothetical protein
MSVLETPTTYFLSAADAELVAAAAATRAPIATQPYAINLLI